MKLDILVRGHKERLIFAVVKVRNGEWPVNYSTRLGPLVVHAVCWIYRGILCRHALVCIRIQIRVPKDVVGRAMILVRSSPQHRVQYSAISMSILRVIE